jgi:hypothetical protein
MLLVADGRRTDMATTVYDVRKRIPQNKRCDKKDRLPTIESTIERNVQLVRISRTRMTTSRQMGRPVERGGVGGSFPGSREIRGAPGPSREGGGRGIE